MIEPLTPVVELHSRLGRVGSIQAWNPWESRKSVEHAKWWVAKVASLSYGNEEAKNPEKLFQSIVERGHLSCLEFVPVLLEDDYGLDTDQKHLPSQSLRSCHDLTGVLGNPAFWGDGRRIVEELQVAADPHYNPSTATAFLVECPLYVRSQWMRHRSFSYLEMSRRYTKGSKVEWNYYGHDFKVDFRTDRLGIDMANNPNGSSSSTSFWQECEAEYQRRLDAGWPNEIARGCMPMEAMTRFWAAGFNRDWEAFLKLRDDAHAQQELRIFAQWIRNFLSSKSPVKAAES